MKKKILLASLLIVVVTFSWLRWRPAQRFDPSTVQADHFRIMTWNVGYFAAVSNKNMRNTDIDEVVEVLRSSQPHVVILQELGTMQQAAQIAEEMGGSWAPYSVKTGHGQQVVSLLTPLPMVAEEDVQCGGRMSKGITVRDQDGNLIYVLGVHSPHPARGVTQNYESITTAVNHTLNRPEEIRFIGGDLNYNFDNDTQDELYHTIMSDFGDGTVATGETYYAHTRIDHIFHFPKPLKVIPAEGGMLDLDFRFARVPGHRDHRPIVVSYDLKKTGK